MLRTYTIVLSLFFVLVCINNQRIYAMTDDTQTQEHDQNKKILEEHIALYAQCKAHSKTDLINLFKYEALSFFIKNIKNQDVLKAILHGIKNYPDRAIKLFFFCLDRQCRGLWDVKSMSQIERFIQTITKTSNDNFQYIIFRYNNVREPILTVHDLSKEWMARDIYDVTEVRGFWCCIL